MFKLSPFRSLAAQRRELLAATEFAPIPLHPAVERQLRLADVAHELPSLRATRPRHLWWYAISENRELIVEAIIWYALSALSVLGAVFFARHTIESAATVWIGIQLAMGYLFLKVVQAVIDYRNANLERQIHRGLQLSLFRCVNTKLIRIAPAGRASFTKGQLKTLVGTDVGAIEDFISSTLYQFVPLIISTIILVPMLSVVSGTVGLIGLGVMFVVVPFASLGAWFVEIIQRRSLAEQDKLATAVGEWVKHIRLVRFLGWSDAIEQEILSILRRLVRWTGLRGGVLAAVYAVSHTWSVMPLVIIVAVSSLRETPLNLVAVFSSFWLLEPLYGRIQAIPACLTRFGAAVAGSHRLLALLAETDIQQLIKPTPSDSREITQPPDRLVVRNLSVHFNGTRALNGISVEFRLDQRTAIVGPVGSGKSTLLEVLVGELPPTMGELFIGFSGELFPLWRADVYHQWRSSVAYSPQQPFLSNTSFQDNLDLSGLRSIEEVEMAIAASQLHDDIALFPRGLREEIGESGINLSGGQKQRVSIARAFLSKRSLLVLDDPLSAVDPKTEGLLMDSIVAESKGLILVSHRLAELQRCDRVLVLEEGRIVEDGDPQTLAEDSSSRFFAFLKAAEAHGI